jgi:hypothetical protein
VKTVLLGLGSRKRSLLLPLLFNVVLEDLARAIRHEKEKHSELGMLLSGTVTMPSMHESLNLIPSIIYLKKERKNPNQQGRNEKCLFANDMILKTPLYMYMYMYMHV